MAKITEEKLERILNAIKRMSYGSLLITIHDEEITQLDITEKDRFPLKKKQDNSTKG